VSSSSLVSPARPKKSRKKLYVFLVILVVVIGAIAASVAQKKSEKPILITTEKAVRKTITEIVTATGKIQPEVEVKISPEVSGEIISLPVVEGQNVSRGDLLLRIKPDSYQAQLEQQEAAASAARSASVRNQAELARAEADYERALSLFEQNLIAESDRKAVETGYDMAKAALESSLFEIDRAEAALRQIREALLKTTIVSPTEGTITALSSRLGERVVGTSQFAGTEVMRIADLSKMEAQVNVNENDVVRVKVGDVARISVDALPDRRIDGVVREIASTATTNFAGTQEEVTYFLVKISIRDQELTLRPGMSTTADIETETVENVVAVPIQSVTVRRTDTDLSPEELERQTARQAAREEQSGETQVTNETLDRQRARAERERLQRVVFVKEGDIVKMKPVETGIADSSHMEIKSGIEPDEEVVSGSYTAISRRLKDGARVEIEKEQK
jgi:HlyD family secretion protein